MTTGNKLQLNDVTLYAFCWGEEHVRHNLKSMLIAMDQIDFEKCVLITNSKQTDLNIFVEILDDNNIEICDMYLDLGVDLKDDSVRESFCTNFIENTKKYITGEFCLNVQSDSTIINPNLWDDEFYDYDYIGAPWPISILRSSDMCTQSVTEFPNVVGNGGFSFRSRKFVEECVGLDIFHKNEDLNICVYNYYNMVNKDIKFAPVEAACKFSVEHPIPGVKNFDRDKIETYKSFGFHGDFNAGGMNFISNYDSFGLPEFPTLEELDMANDYGTDKNTTHSYFPVYNRILKDYRDATMVLEIGANSGNSLRMWHDYFTKAHLYSFEINPVPALIQINEDYPRIHIELETNAYTDKEIERFGEMEFDVIIDDGPHTPESQAFTLSKYIKLLSPDGIMIIEDIQNPNFINPLLSYIPEGFDAEVVDLRNIKDRFDDIMIIVRKQI